MYKLQIMTLPDHVVYHYTLSANVKHASSFALNANFLSIRLTGRFRTEVSDPNQLIPEAERLVETQSPSVHRAGVSSLKATVTVIEDGTVICLYPKDELINIMSAEEAGKLIALPPYTLAAVYEGR